MDLPPISDAAKRTLCTDVAMRLGAAHGRRPYYAAADVMVALRECRLPVACTLWACAVYCTPPVFAAVAAEAASGAEYSALRREMARFVPPAKLESPVSVDARERPGWGEAPDMVEVVVDGGELVLDLVGSIFSALDGL